MRSPFRFLPLVVALALPVPVLAQDGPMGIAFVQAPEMSSGVAMGRTPQDAFAAATAQCVDGGGYAEDCLPTNWCFPAGFSVDAFVMHQEGLHWHEVVCGLASQEVAQAVGEALCDVSVRPYISECAVVQLYDPQGNTLIAY